MMRRDSTGSIRILAILVVIGVLFFAIGFAGEPSHAVASDNSDLVLALDISNWSGTITASEVACWWESGIRHVIAGTQIPSITIQQLQTALDGGMTVDAYVMLYWDYDIAGQVQDAFVTIAGFPVGRLWLDAEQPAGGWFAYQLIRKIQEAVDACGSFPCGIYTRKAWWLHNVANSDTFSHLPIWYAYYDHNSDFDDWYDPVFWWEGPFGGWTEPTGKQYDSDWTAPDLCGVNVDYNIMYIDDVQHLGTAPGEVGIVTVNQPDNSVWHTIDLVNQYQNPVVIMQPASFNSGQPTTIRLQNITETSFEYQIDEWDYLDGSHVTETLGYLVMEAGTYQLQDGTRIEVGATDVDHTFTTATFSQTFATTPVVLTQVQTVNESSAVVTRQQDTSVESFQVKIQEEEGSDGLHATESVGYIAIEPGSGMTGDMAYEAAVTPNAVTHEWYPIEFQQDYSNPVFLAGMQSYDGGNTAGLRYRALETGGAQIIVEEEASADPEIRHTTETVGYVVFNQPGSLSVVGPPFAPDGLNPADGATITTSAVTLSCAAITDAIGYEFEIGYGDGVTWQYYYTYSPTTNSQTFWPVFDDTTYRWRVRAENAHGLGEWSDWVTFNFGDVGGGNSVPPAPSGLIPADGATITTSAVTLSCAAITDAIGYEFEIEYGDGVTWQYYYTYSPTSNSQTFWPVIDNTTYRWRVRAENSFGWGAWSVWTMFEFF